MKKLENTLNNVRVDTAILELAPELEFSRSKIQKMIESAEITVNSKPVKSSFKLKAGDIIEINEQKKDVGCILPEKIDLDIVFEDDFLLVLNKQKGILTHPTPLNKTGTLVNALLYYGCALSDIQGEERRGIVHRLDKNTSGLILIAKTNEAHINLQKQIQSKEAKRKYLAVVHGIIEENEGIIDKPLVHFMQKTVKMNIAKENEGQEAITLFKVLERFEDLTLVELELKTGRTHQIRCHMASINHPVYGDTLYGAKGFRSKLNFKTTEQLLMSYYLNFTHPKTGDIMEFKLDESRYDNDFKRFFTIIKKENKNNEFNNGIFNI